MIGMSTWWQRLPENMDPVLLQLGGFSIQYYGLMYLLAFLTVYLLARYRIARESRFSFDIDVLQSLMLAMIIGVLAGGRLGYVLFYNFRYYLRHPLEIILPFDIRNGWRFVGIAGMSFHGGLIGAVLAAWIYIRRKDLSFLDAADLIIPCVPLGYTFGRIGNFINGELYGRVTESGFGMFFPAAPGSGLRHPSQLYEAFGEGILLFFILWLLRKRIRVPGAMLAFYLLGYGLIRFLIEFSREPDAHLGFVVLRLSMGQLLCIGMILAGIALYVVLDRRYRQGKPAS